MSECLNGWLTAYLGLSAIDLPTCVSYDAAMKSISLPIFFVAGLLMAACTNQVPLAYVPTMPIAMQALPAVGQITAVDQRGESDPTWIGAVRGGFGNPLKVLNTPKPLAEMVVDAFHAALNRRGFLAPAGAGQVDLSVAITEFNSTKFVRREANVTMIVELRDHVSGKQIYRNEVKAHPLEGSLLALDNGVFGSVDELQAITQSAMNQAIDAALNQPEFTTALRSVSPPVS